MSSRKSRVLLAVVAGLCFPATLLAAEGKAAPAKQSAKQSSKPTAKRSAKPAAKTAKLTARQIVEKHLAARGGLRAWEGVQSMAWNGKMEVGYGDSVARSAKFLSTATAKGRAARQQAAAEAAKAEPRKQVQLPFVAEMKRPTKSRIEIEFAGKTAVQVYDGTSGWMLRPFLNRDDWQPFSAEQAKAQGTWEFDGPLLDAAAKGTKVELVSVEPVEGRDAYKLKLTHKDGAVQHVWIDAKSFLDVKVEGAPRRMDGKMRTVWVTQRDFRPVKGLMVPFVLETAIDGSPDTHKVLIDKVALNPQLDDARFTKPKA